VEIATLPSVARNDDRGDCHSWLRQPCNDDRLSFVLGLLALAGSDLQSARRQLECSYNLSSNTGET
jgi:hypothetical protein